MLINDRNRMLNTLEEKNRFKKLDFINENNEENKDNSNESGSN